MILTVWLVIFLLSSVLLGCSVIIATGSYEWGGVAVMSPSVLLAVIRLAQILSVIDKRIVEAEARSDEDEIGS